MKLTDDDVKAFIQVYKKEFGKTLDHDEARQRAEGIVALYEILGGDNSKPDPGSNPSSLQKE